MFPRVCGNQGRTMMSSRFDRNSPTWSLARRCVNDVPPEATGMLHARWVVSAANHSPQTRPSDVRSSRLPSRPALLHDTARGKVAMDRRAFLGTLAVLAAPLAATAQQPAGKVARLGV